MVSPRGVLVRPALVLAVIVLAHTSVSARQNGMVQNGPGAKTTVLLHRLARHRARTAFVLGVLLDAGSAWVVGTNLGHGSTR